MSRRATFFRRHVQAPRAGLRPTRSGVCWLVAVLGLLATAINYSNNLIFAMAFVMLSLWLQSAWLCRRNLRGLRWHPAAPVPVFTGERLAVGGIVVETGGYRRQGLQLAAAEASSTPAAVAPSSDVRLFAHVPTVRRGVRTVAPLALESTYPFGLWRQRAHLPAMEALVYPAPAGDAPLPTAAPVPAHRSFATDNYQGVRRYAPGDPTRRINWRVFGRTCELMVNQFDGAAGGDALWLRWDQTQGETEERLSQLAAWIVAAQRDGLDYGLQVGRTQFPPQHGAEHQAACLSALACFDAAESSQPEAIAV